MKEFLRDIGQEVMGCEKCSKEKGFNWRTIHSKKVYRIARSWFTIIACRECGNEKNRMRIG
jgi:hypothetical protein